MVIELSERAAMVERIRQMLAERPEIVVACLHGSFVDEGAHRDIDIAVWLDPTRVTPAERARYALDLAVTLSLGRRTPIDVQALNDAPLAFRYHALTGMPLVVRDPEFFDDLRARTWDEYFDFLPFARQYLREVLSG